MNKVGEINDFCVYLLEKSVATQYIAQLIEMLNQIPCVSYQREDILSEAKRGRVFYGKWKHSLIVLHGQTPVATIMGYERQSEHTDQYPDNTIYISEFAVATPYQKKGIGKKLLKLFLSYNVQRGFLYLTGDINFSAQTNIAEFNHHVRKLYLSCGFKERGVKHYDNRTDVIMGLDTKAV